VLTTTTTWLVDKVTGDRNETTAELIQVDWYKPNPEHARLLADDTYDGDMPDEWLDAARGEDGADFVELDGRMTLDITPGPNLRPDDNVVITLTLVRDREEAG
jgi:hypothetical protein